MAIATKSIPVKAHWSMKMVERYHIVLQRVYKMMVDNLKKCGLNKKIIL